MPRNRRSSRPVLGAGKALTAWTLSGSGRMPLASMQDVVDVDKAVLDASGDGVDEPLETLGRVAQAEGHLEELDKAKGCCNRGLRCLGAASEYGSRRVLSQWVPVRRCAAVEGAVVTARWPLCGLLLGYHVQCVPWLPVACVAVTARACTGRVVQLFLLDARRCWVPTTIVWLVRCPDVDRNAVMWKKSAPMMVTPTSATMNVQVKAGRLGNWTVIVFLPRWLTGVPLTACSIGLLDAGCAGCFCDPVAGSKLTAAPVSIKIIIN
ncbi:hypothetical protein T08_1475 [Trichinella sp. T8]|nr:hypothetical protein T08_1475 [Trichinella sp. T8]